MGYQRATNGLPMHYQQGFLLQIQWTKSRQLDTRAHIAYLNGIWSGPLSW